jgi:hypothetical protein
LHCLLFDPEYGGNIFHRKSLNFYQSIRRRHSHRYENLKSNYL